MTHTMCKAQGPHKVCEAWGVSYGCVFLWSLEIDRHRGSPKSMRYNSMGYTIGAGQSVASLLAEGGKVLLQQWCAAATVPANLHDSCT
jgi:hypothetical protein